MAERQIFIIGTGRSGTTILRKILGLHSQTYVYSHELRFIADTNGLVDLATDLTVNWNPFNASKAIDEFCSLMRTYLWKEPLHHTLISAFYYLVLQGGGRKYRFVDFSEDVPVSHLQSMLDRLIDEITVDQFAGHWYGTDSYTARPHLHVTQPFQEQELYPILGQFVDDLLSYPLKGTSKEVWCDDTPINIMQAHRIAKMLGSARMIHLYRDPRDVVASYADSRQAWAPNDPELSAIWVREIIEHWFQVRKLIPDHQYLEIKYEDMVKNQKENMIKILNFIGCEYDESLEGISLTDESVGGYKNEMSRGKIEKVNDVVKPILDEYYK